MTHDDIFKLYTSTLEAHHCQPKDGELDSWKTVLQNFTRGQLDAALRRWENDTELEEWTGRPRGSRMPSPAELKFSIQTFERLQTAVAGGRFAPCDQCNHTGWIVGVDKRARRCECFWKFIRAKKGAA